MLTEKPFALNAYIFKNNTFFRQWWDLCHKGSQAPGNKVRSKLLKLELPDSFPPYNAYEAYIKPEVDSSKENFSWGLPNLDVLRQYPFFAFIIIHNLSMNGS